jgi:nitrite reductase (NADH) large subunit
MSEEHCVIIGNGPAANRAAFTLKELAPNLRVTMFGREVEGIHKPQLLPDYIAGKILERELWLTPLEVYKECGINIRLGQEVVRVDAGKRHLLLTHKEVVPFTGLIIAVGGKPRIPEPLQVFTDLMLTLKKPADARAWIHKLSQIESVMLVGGDLTSLVFAKALLSLGKRVTFLLDEDSFWPVQFNRDIEREVARRLIHRGAEVLEGEKLRRVTRVGEHALDCTTDQRTLRVGALGAFFGLVPDVKFLSRSGLDIDRGILVDEHLKTLFEGIYAAGDCAQVYHPELRDYWVSIGYQNALSLGRVAALNLSGGRLEAEPSAESIFKIGDIAVNTSWWLEF